MGVSPAISDRRMMTDTTPARPPREEHPPAVRPLWNIIERQNYEAQLAARDRRISELENAILMKDQAERYDREMTLYGGAGTLDDAKALVSGSPRFSDLTPLECEYAARVALATGLNPEFELHPFKDNRGRLVLVPDYAALIRKARNRHNLMVKDRRLTATEMRARGIPQKDVDEGSIAYLVEGYELDKALKCKMIGIEYEPLRGYGWWAAMKDETRWDERAKRKLPTGKRVPNDIPNGRDGEFVAWKRATRALFKQLTDLGLRFGRVDGAQQGEDEDEYIFETAGKNIIQGTVIETPPAPAPTSAPSRCTRPGCTDPGDVTPLGFLCPAHARQAADLEAAKS